MRKTILLVDDDAITSRLETKILNNEGYHVIPAFSGEEAIEKAGQQHDTIDLILMDIDMGNGMDGTEAASAILMSHDIPVLFLSSHTEKEIVDRTEKITSYGYVVKGSGKIVLLASIKMAMKLHDANTVLVKKNEEIVTINSSLNATIKELENTNRGLIRTWEKLLESEKELMESRNEFMGYFNMNTVGMSVISPDGRWVRANERLCSMLGYTMEELSMLTWAQVTHPDDLGDNLKLFEGMLSGEIDKYEIRKRFIRKNGGLVYALAYVTCRLNTRGEVKFILASFLDVTEQNRIENDLLDRERQYSALLQNLPGMVYRCRQDHDCTMLFVSNGCLSLTGYSAEDFIENRKVSYIDLVLPEYRETLLAKKEESMAGGKNFMEEYLIHCADGSVKWVWEHGRGIFDEKGDIIFFEGYIEDITPRKLGEIELHSREEKFNKAFHNAPLLMTINEIDDGTYIEVNDMFVKVSGFTREEILGKRSTELGWISHSDRKRIVESIKRDGRVAALEITYTSKEKKPVSCLYYGEVITLDGNRCLLSIVHDISGIKRTEDELKKSEERWDFALNGSRDGVWDWNIPENEVFFSRRWKEMLGYGPEEITGTMEEWKTRLHPRDRGKCFRDMQDHMDGISPFFENEHRVLCRDGSYKWVLGRGKVMVRDDDNRPVRAVGTLTDIAERKKLEEKHSESEAKFRDLTEKAIVGVYLFQDDLFKYVNPRFAQIFGYEVEEIIDKMGPRELTHSEDWQFAGENIKKRDTGEAKSVHYTFRGLSKNGEIIYAEVYGTRTTFNGNTAIIGTLMDITKRKIAEDRIAESLKEKELLLSEIHHRVKNNMQVIISLLSLQSDLMDDESARESFRECISRIQSMALVHEKLYQSGDMASINFREYINDLIEKIFISSIDKSRNIRTSININDINFGIDLAIPCGLIITELVTNALKHAFPEGRHGEISLELEKPREGIYSLHVKDDGIGIPASVNKGGKSTLGYSLVDALVRQIKGEINISADEGTTININFPVK